MCVCVSGVLFQHNGGLAKISPVIPVLHRHKTCPLHIHAKYAKFKLSERDYLNILMILDDINVKLC